MKIIDPGHKYELDHLDGINKSILTFVKREGNKFPGNIGHYEGTNLQEVLRILINRIEYLNNQVPDKRNLVIIHKLLKSIWLLEDRAAERHNRDFDYHYIDIDKEPTCNNCGHIGCNGECKLHDKI